MKLARFVLLLPAFTLPVLLVAQAGTHSAESSVQAPEFNLILEPGPPVDGVPVNFVFHLLNVGSQDLRLPEPNVDCSNATANGSVWLNESWQPSTGTGLGKGAGSCDVGSSELIPSPITEIAKKWHIVKPGESFYIQATQANLHFESSRSGVYTFSAVYFPPSLDISQVRALESAGIAIPHRKATSGSLRYEKR